MRRCDIGGTVLVRSLRPRSVASEHGIYVPGHNGAGIWMKCLSALTYLWRAVDQEGEGLEAYVTKRRNRKAALTFLRKAMKRHGRPETIVTDKLGSYRAALRTIGNAACQETGRWRNNRAENSH
jgi:putative transposase